MLFWNKGYLDSYIEFSNVLLVSILWNNFRSISISSSFKVWKNSELNSSVPGLFLVEKLLMTASISLGDIGLFKLFFDLDLALVSVVYGGNWPFVLDF